MQSNDEQEILQKIPGQVRDLVYVKDGCVLPGYAKLRYVNEIRHFKLRDSDTLVVTWMKSGTTWTQFLINQIVRGQEYADNHTLFDMHIFLEHPQNHTGEEADGRYKLAENRPSPRFMKSHLPLRFLPEDILRKQLKIIYVARNPKDATVSYYNFCLVNRVFPTYPSWNEFFEQLCQGTLPYGDWFDHVLGFWKIRDNPNILFMKYEDMKRDLHKHVRVLGEFLGKSLSEDEIDVICSKSTFSKMKENPNINPDKKGMDWGDWRKPEGDGVDFMRKGVVGEWKNWFTVAQNERFNAIYREKMKGTGLEFEFE